NKEELRDEADSGDLPRTLHIIADLSSREQTLSKPQIIAQWFHSLTGQLLQDPRAGIRILSTGIGEDINTEISCAFYAVSAYGEKRNYSSLFLPGVPAQSLRVASLRLWVGERVLTVVCCYAPNGSSEYPLFLGSLGRVLDSAPNWGLHCLTGGLQRSHGQRPGWE
ncbi:hypothetical protein L3Q82_024055, partial [Scortum barcoo]